MLEPQVFNGSTERKMRSALLRATIIFIFGLKKESEKLSKNLSKKSFWTPSQKNSASPDNASS